MTAAWNGVQSTRLTSGYRLSQRRARSFVYGKCHLGSRRKLELRRKGRGWLGHYQSPTQAIAVLFKAFRSCQRDLHEVAPFALVSFLSAGAGGPHSPATGSLKLVANPSRAIDAAHQSPDGWRRRAATRPRSSPLSVPLVLNAQMEIK